jgi:hypothetical protein
MWSKAVNEARSVLEDVSPTDRVCVMSFDTEPRTLIGFEQWQTLEPARRVPAAIEQISELSPGWAGTVLGQALVNAAEAIQDDEVNEQQQRTGLRKIVLVSDLQQGSRLETLRTYEWPEGTELVVKPITPEGTTNATLQLLRNRDDLAAADSQTRSPVRITNSPDATSEQFALRWAEQNDAGELMDVYVAPGRSVVVDVPNREDESTARELILTGDDHDFDNTLYLAPHLKQQISIVYVGGEDPNDPKEMPYYLQRCFGASQALNPKIIYQSAESDLADANIAAAHFVIVADVPEQGTVGALKQYLESGRTALLVMSSPESIATVGALTGVEDLQSEEAEIDGYAMLDRIEFNHPLLAPFAEPRFGDFTRIGFWKYRTIDTSRLPDARVLASFDSNEPALFEHPVGSGSLLVLASSWHPSDSQLALSSKFVPLLYSILEYGGVLIGQRSQHFVGDSIPIPRSRITEPTDLKIRKPDDSVISHHRDQQSFAEADQPGIYTIESPADKRLFAVNLSVAESRTAAMSVEDLEGLGVSLGQSSSVPAELVKQASRRSSFVDLESEQKLWRWALVGLLAVALIEIWLAGWLSRSAPTAGRQQE